MSRLVHSVGGYLRSTQISNCQIFAHVEGALDRPFYERVLQNVLGKDRQFRIVSSKELPGGTGGKLRLISWFKSLRRKSGLAATAFGKKLVNLFFLDKDADDAIQKKLRSPYLIYTKTYDLEGHLISSGNFHRALADAAGVTSTQAALIMSDPVEWTAAQVSNWIDWTALCMVSQYRSINVGCTYDRISAINPEIFGPVSVRLFEGYKDRLREQFAVCNFDFDKDFDLMRKKILKSLKDGNSLKYFKGKWFVSILQKFASASITIPDAQSNGIGDRVILSLIGQTGIESRCRLSEYFRNPIADAVSVINS